VAIIEKALADLNAILNEAVVFATLIDGRRVVVRSLNADRAITVSQTILNADNHIYTTPTGRALTAFADAAGLQRILDVHGFPGTQWDGIDGMRALQQALDGIRAKGACVFAPDPRDLAAFGFPVLTRAGELLGALGCFAPMFRCTPDQHESVLRELSRAAVPLREALSAHRGVPPGSARVREA
jgi:DNA-binding IclR family transcriptional regulator